MRAIAGFTLQEIFILFPTPFHHVIGLGPGYLPQNYQIGDPKTDRRVLALKETSVAAVEIGFPDSRARLRIPLILGRQTKGLVGVRLLQPVNNTHCLLSLTHMHICKC